MPNYNVYPAVDEKFNFPPQIRDAFSRSPEFGSQIVNQVASVISDAAIVTEATKLAVTKELAYREVPTILTERAFATERPMSDVSTRGLWRFENDLLDSSTYKNDLISDGDVPQLAAGSARFGTYGRKSGRFKSLTADSFTTEGSLLPDMTIEGWVRTTASNLQVMAGRGNSAWLGMNADGTVYGAYVKENGTDGYFITSAKINDGQWHHIALVVRKGAGGSIYCDGIRVGHNTTIAGWRMTPKSGNNTSFAIGGLGASLYTYYWVGDIDEVRLSDTVRTFDVGYGVRPNVPGGFVTYVGNSEPTDMVAGDVWRRVSL